MSGPGLSRRSAAGPVRDMAEFRISVRDAAVTSTTLAAMMAADVAGLRDSINNAITVSTREALGLIRAHVAGRLGGRAANTVTSELGLDIRPGGDPHGVVGTVYSRWWRKHEGRLMVVGKGVQVRANRKTVNVLDAWETGPAVVTWARNQYHAIPTPLAGKGKGGGKMTVEKWIARHRRKLRVVPLGRIGAGKAQAALVADVRLGVRTGEAKARGLKRARSVARQEVIFWLVKQIAFRRRLDTQPIKDRVDAALPDKILGFAERRGILST